LASWIGIFALSAVAATSAQAGGFSYHGGVNEAAASSKATSEAEGDLINFASSALANTFARVDLQGVFASAFAGTDGSTYIIGEAEFNQLNKSKAKVYQKGGAVMAKARAEVTTTIYVNGQAYLVSIDIARAIARATPHSATGAADAMSLISGSSSGYLGVVSGTQSEATVRSSN
jgi:hypothetical protein